MDYTHHSFISAFISQHSTCYSFSWWAQTRMTTFSYSAVKRNIHLFLLFKNNVSFPSSIKEKPYFFYSNPKISSEEKLVSRSVTR